MMRGEMVVLLTHYPPKFPGPPWDQTPKHWTFTCIANFVDELKPIAVVQGHVHTWFGQQWRRDNTLIVNPGPRGGVLTISHDGTVSSTLL